MPIGTTRWVVTDPSREETFAPGSTRDVEIVDVQDTLHLDFTDMHFWGGPLRERGAYGKIDPSRAAGIARRVVGGFFAQITQTVK